jgi:hypothetical protein
VGTFEAFLLVLDAEGIASPIPVKIAEMKH